MKVLANGVKPGISINSNISLFIHDDLHDRRRRSDKIRGNSMGYGEQI